MTAKKDKTAKPDLSLIPYCVEVALAEALMDGEVKYGRYNYCKGHSISELVAAARRHLGQFLDGEDVASDSGRSHLAHALANIAMMIHEQELGTLRDDRYKPTEALSEVPTTDCGSAPKLQLRVGGKYLTRDGAKQFLIVRNDGGGLMPFVSEEGYYFTPTGSFTTFDDHDDMWDLVQEVTEPATSEQEFAAVLREAIAAVPDFPEDRIDFVQDGKVVGRITNLGDSDQGYIPPLDREYEIVAVSTLASAKEFVVERCWDLTLAQHRLEQQKQEWPSFRLTIREVESEHS